MIVYRGLGPGKAAITSIAGLVSMPTGDTWCPPNAAPNAKRVAVWSEIFYPYEGAQSNIYNSQMTVGGKFHNALSDYGDPIDLINAAIDDYNNGDHSGETNFKPYRRLNTDKAYLTNIGVLGAVKQTTI